MAEFNRKGSSVWTGDLRSGSGKISTSSGALSGVDYRYATRFDNEPGTNPEELIAAAHASCFNMALAGALKRNGHEAAQLETHATCTIASKEGGGFRISSMHLEVRGTVPGLDESEFERIVGDANQGCPVSNLLRDCLQLTIQASMS
jgi:osmotically inducible protein OsmC